MMNYKAVKLDKDYAHHKRSTSPTPLIFSLIIMDDVPNMHWIKIQKKQVSQDKITQVIGDNL